jgi:hypothetical protein
MTMGRKNRNRNNDENLKDDQSLDGTGIESGAENATGELVEGVSEQPLDETLDPVEDEVIDFSELPETPVLLEPGSHSADHVALQPTDDELIVLDGDDVVAETPVVEQEGGRYKDILLHPELAANRPVPEIDLEYAGMPGLPPQEAEVVQPTPEVDAPVAELTEPEPETPEPESTAPAVVETPEPEPEAPLEEAVEDAAPERNLRLELAHVLPAQALKAWPEKHLVLFEKTGAWPEKTRRGNWLEDIRRQANLKDWQTSELEDWLDGKIATPRGVDSDLIVDEIFRRWRLPGNWTLDAVRAFIATGEKPGYTKDGVLIEDRTRDTAPISHWTYLELRAALLGQIEVRHERKDVVAQFRTRLGLRDSYSEEKLLADLDKSQTEVNMDMVVLKHKLEEYKTAMTQHGPHLTEATAAKAQLMLYKVIRDVMKQDPATFAEGWLIILNWINVEYNTLFNMGRAYYGWSKISLSKPALTSFEELLGLMIDTRTPAARMAGTGFRNVETILRHIPSEEERQNIIQFYAKPF